MNTSATIAGFQAAGTRGRSLAEGTKEIKMHGGFIRVGAKIETLHGLSAHANQQGLLEWLSGFERPPATTYVGHGEPPAAISRCKLGWAARVAQDGEHVELAGGGS